MKQSSPWQGLPPSIQATLINLGYTCTDAVKVALENGALHWRRRHCRLSLPAYIQLCIWAKEEPRDYPLPDQPLAQLSLPGLKVLNAIPWKQPEQVRTAIRSGMLHPRRHCISSRVFSELCIWSNV